MRVTAEYRDQTDQIRVRLLGTLDPVTHVQTGLYGVDGTPAWPQILSFDVSSEQVVNDEVAIWLTGLHPVPDVLVVTLPDLSTQTVPTVKVERTEPSALMEHPAITIAPEEKPDHNPTGAYSVAGQMSPASVPPFWFELRFGQADPLVVGDGVEGTLTYEGGCAGRALSATMAQSAQDAAPYRESAPTHLEGGFTNALPNANLAATHSVVGLYDEVPDGWDFQVADPGAMLRVTVESVGLLPAMTLQYHKRPGAFSMSSPPITILTPPVPNDHEFRAIFDIAADNAPGRLALETFDHDVSTGYQNLTESVSLGINVASHGDRVRLLWDQSAGDGEAQTLRILIPTATQYVGAHTWTPEGSAMAADRCSATLLYPTWYFAAGSLKIDTLVENVSTPVSWELRLGSDVLLSLQGGTLASAFSSAAPFLLVPYLPVDQPGKYTLSWQPGQPLRILGAGAAPAGTVLPLALDLPIPDLTLPLTATLTSFGAQEGSGLIRYFALTP